MEGYLQIWQGFLPHWNKYYFRIHEELLIFGPNKQEIEGRIHLKIAQIISKLDDPISLIIHTGTDVIQLRAFSIDEKVKWFKKLKEVQKQVIDLSHNKELFKMRVELSKVNRFKILDDLNTELWKCHAELEQRLEEVIEKVKNIQILKSVDRLRISIDEFKYKTSQMLQYIDEEIRDLKVKDKEKSTNSKKNNYQTQIDMNEDFNQEDTQFFSFYHIGTKAKTKQPYKQKQLIKMSRIAQQQHSLSSLSNNLRQKKSIFETPKPARKFNTRSQLSNENEDSHNLKKRLINQNKVFLKYNNIVSFSQSRQSLPMQFTPQQKFGVVSTLMSAISSGADLTKMSMPIAMNEPLSILQKGCEPLLYSYLLNKADEANDQNARMLYVAAFTVAGYSLHEFRTKMPFTPLLGQTYQFVDDQKGYQYLAQQVCQNPPISAYYVRSDNYEIFDNSKCKVAFTGNGIKQIPQSKAVIKLQKNNDFYVIGKCQITLTNILFGKTCMQVSGTVSIRCKQFDTSVVLQFKEQSFWKENATCRVSGYLQNQGKKLYQLQGSWNKELIIQNVLTKEKSVIWKKTHQVLTQYYNYNELSVQLNHLSSNAFKNLPPTDSRFRPDQRALQFKDIELANAQKIRLQQKQRLKDSPQQKHKALWFKESVLQGEDVYMSNQRYWDQKIKGVWKESKDLF